MIANSVFKYFVILLLIKKKNKHIIETTAIKIGKIIGYPYTRNTIKKSKPKNMTTIVNIRMHSNLFSF